MKKLLLAFFMLFATVAKAETITLSSNNFLALKEQVTDESVSVLIEKLFLTKEKSVILYLNSPGGSIMAGNKLINAMKATGIKTICIADFAASMAFSIFQQCDERLYLDSSVIMQHEGSYGVEGNVSEIRTQVEFAEKLMNTLNKQDAKRLGIDVAKFQKLIHNEWWLYGDDIKLNNAGDRQVQIKCTAELTAKTEVQTIQSLFGAIELTWSQCPLVLYPKAVKMAKEKDVSHQTFVAWYKSLDLNRDWKTTRTVK